MLCFKNKRRAALSLVALLTSGSAFAQTSLPPGTQLLSPDCSTSFNGYGLDGPGDGSSSIDITDPALPFSKAVQIVYANAKTNNYDAVMFCDTLTKDAAGNDVKIAKDDVLVATFWIHNINADPHAAPLRLEPKFQFSSPPYKAFLQTNAPVDAGDWKRYSIPFRMLADAAVGTTNFNVSFGNVAQSFEVGGVTLVNYGKLASPLPEGLQSQFSFYYPGRGDKNAAWRKTALANIEAIRKTNLTIAVTKADGSPASGVSLQLKQVKSSFNWATIVDATDLLKDISVSGLTLQDQRRYRAAVKANFNSAGGGSELKWPDWESDKPLAAALQDWSRANGLATSRGHNLIWPSYGEYFKLPDDVRDPKATPAYTRKRILSHFDEELGAFRGQLAEWDVVNEPFSNHDVQGLVEVPSNDPNNPLVKHENGKLGNHAIVDWFKRARKDDPSTLLFINDDHIFDTLDPLHRIYTQKLITYMIANGAPLDGLGFQSHFNGTGPVFTDMIESLAMFDPLVKHFSATEFDFTTLDGAMQADLTSDFMTFIFGSPKFNILQMWGFWDTNHWLGDGPLYTKDWKLKPSGKVWQTLTQKTWRTNAKGTTDGSGKYATRAFFGTYQITVSACGKTTTYTRDVTATTSLTLPAGC